MKYRRNNRHSDNGHEYWQSYSDMMATLLLMFILITAVTLLGAQKNYEIKNHEILETKSELYQSKQQIEQIVGIRSKLIDSLKTEFAQTSLKISVDSQTGAIAFDSNLLFDYNQDVLNANGTAFLMEFLPKYFSILLSDDFSEYVAEIIIEGHTDTQGDYMYNLDLSQKRALAVAAFCVSDNQTLFNEQNKARLREIVTANGRSMSKPIYNSLGQVDMEKSRRVEIKFRLKDDEMIAEMQKILGGQQ